MQNISNIETISVNLGKFGNIPIIPKPRNRFSPIKVSHEIQTANIMIEIDNSLCTLNVNGMPVKNENGFYPVTLNTGINVVSVEIMDIRKNVAKSIELKFFRSFPTPIWKKVIENAKWPARDSAGELVFDNKMWLLGGFTPKLVSDIWKSSDGINWDYMSIIPSEKGIDIPVCIVFDNKMWVSDIEGKLFSSLDGKSWNLITEQAPWKGRTGMGSAVFNNRIWVMGGAKDGEVFNDIWSSSNGKDWKLETKNAAWSKRQIHHTPLVLNDKIWLIGGGIFTGSYYPFTAYNDVWCSSDGRHWTKILDHAPWEPRIWGSSVVYKNRLWLIGGFQSEPEWKNLEDVWYSGDGMTWNRLETIPQCQNTALTIPSAWKARHEMSVYAFKDKLWLVAGMEWPLVNDVWCLDIPKISFLTQPVLETYAGLLYEYRAKADFNQIPFNTIKYRLSTKPDWLNIDTTTGTLSGIPPLSGRVKICIEAYDAKGEMTCQSYELDILQLD